MYSYAMSFKNKISISLLTLALAVVLSAGILHWGAGQAAYNLKRSTLAQEQLATYLTLSADTYQFFKQVLRNMIDGDGLQTFDFLQVQQSFEASLSNLKRQVDYERLLPLWKEEEENNELDRLASLTTEIGLALDEVNAGFHLIESGQREAAIALVTSTLELRIDGTISKIFEAGLADERNEVKAAKIELNTLVTSLRATALITAAMAILFAFGAIWFLLHHLRNPMAILSEGTKRIAAGQLNHRINIPGTDIFASLAMRFNEMAADLKHQHEQLRRSKKLLEIKVIERTAQLREVNLDLTNQANLRHQLIADVGHELRTPITIIRGEAEVALRNKKTGEEIIKIYREALGHVVDVSGQLTHLVNDLFLIARSQAGEVDMRSKSLDLGALVKTVAEEMHVFLLKKKIELNHYTPHTPTMIMGDSARLRQLLMILINNAAQHGGEGVTITLSLEVNTDIAELVLSDTGAGIAEADIAHVFERYYRGDAAVQNSISGTGLGLPIAKTIAIAHGGTIVVKNKLDVGTTFCIQLPLDQITQNEQETS